ncbi:hypothetical protein A1O7_06761 [Cladophialophora yegresii CBS 114405]|uniref:Borealin N-terminal domain-containing protein n=1 Tax=Cladophialophora yegresii CBS 114405 TaxID=1182544 RepID=W9VLN6_9EURO|nr:uncharacterized protein A1O7_06761 [Cladophialophora yegresii CBS 114405]EXJ56418.1 hypothetical protein A1O7_06761 [Cladophialophora yegresii CBS 114405]
MTRKRKSEDIEEIEDQPAGAVTPTGSPPLKKMRITLQQKQALMDNLQLEITERARQLRAGYALQCADLRARIERRVNRIPLTMRKMTMRELMEQHQPARPVKDAPRASPPKQTISVEVPTPKRKPLPPLPQEHASTKLQSSARQQAQQVQQAPTRGKKRPSSEIQIASDKENERHPDTLPVVKNNKRPKATTAQATRTTSRTAKHPTTSVLSPRSHNSRTLPRSPIKDLYLPTSPAKSMIARPTTAMSPVRSTSPFKSAATAATSAISASMHGMYEQAKRGGTATAAKLTRTASKEKKETSTAVAKGQMLPPPKPKPSVPASPQRTFSQASTHSNSTDVSAASSGTTVVKPKRGGRTATAVSKTAKIAAEPVSPAEKKKKGGVARAASVAKTALKRNAGTTRTANKKVVVAEPAAGKRVLRNRA